MDPNSERLLSPPAVPHRLSSPLSSEAADHLREQVRIVSNLYDQNHHNLLKAESDWILNAISYTKHTLDSFTTHNRELKTQSKLHRRLASLNVSARDRSILSQAAVWNSQFLIATQNLNGAMGLLSRVIRYDEPLDQKSFTATGHVSSKVEPDNELSRFLNRRRAGRSIASAIAFRREMHYDGGVESSSVGLRTTHSLVVTSTEAVSTEEVANGTGLNELPLTLVGTVERWRQNAEDALKAAMHPYIEMDELLKWDVASPLMTEGSGLCELDTFRDHPTGSKTSNWKIEAIDTRDAATSTPRAWSPTAQSLKTASLSRIPHRKPVAQVVSYGTASPSSKPHFSPSVTTDRVNSSETSQRPLTHTLPTSLAYQPALKQHTTTTYEAYDALEPSLTSATTLSTTRQLYSPFLTTNSDAQVSAVSLVSSMNHDPRLPSLDVHRTTFIPHSEMKPDLKRAWGAVPLSEQQIEPCSSHASPKQRMSRGRAWLERQAGMHT